jgi:predicted nucleic acid-binding protein
MEEFVTDTMAIVLFLEKRKLPIQIKNIFERADAGDVFIIIPPMVLAEIAYLSEKNRIDLSIASLENYIKQHPNYKIAFMGIDEIKAAFEITDIPELHDRIIAGTAKSLNVKILTNDPVIIASKFIESLWT